MSPIARSHRVRVAAVALGLGAALTLTGCGFDAQTLQPYTPADGVNLTQDTLKVRNLLIIVDDAGKGRLSGQLTNGSKADTLTGVSGTALKVDGTPAGAITAATPSVKIPAGGMAVLTQPGNEVTLSSPDLKAGLGSQLKLTFASGVTMDARVPVVSASNPIYAEAAGGSAAPSPAVATASEHATATPSAQPTHK